MFINVFPKDRIITFLRIFLLKSIFRWGSLKIIFPQKISLSIYSLKEVWNRFCIRLICWTYFLLSPFYITFKISLFHITFLFSPQLLWFENDWFEKWFENRWNLLVMCWSFCRVKVEFYFITITTRYTIKKFYRNFFHCFVDVSSFFCIISLLID